MGKSGKPIFALFLCLILFFSLFPDLKVLASDRPEVTEPDLDVQSEQHYVKAETDAVIYSDEGRDLGRLLAGAIVQYQKIQDDRVYIQWDDHNAYIKREDVHILNDQPDTDDVVFSDDALSSIGKIQFTEVTEVRSGVNEQEPFAVINEGEVYAVSEKNRESYYIMIGNRLGTIEKSKVEMRDTSSAQLEEAVANEGTEDDDLEKSKTKKEDSEGDSQPEKELLDADRNQNVKLHRAHVKAGSASEDNQKFTLNTRFFKVMQDNVSIYDNQKGQLVKVGELRKGQVYPRVRDYGNWHEIRFGKGFAYVWKAATEPANGNGLQHINTGYRMSENTIKAIKDLTVYDNASGSLVPFATILKGQEYPVISDYGNWYRIDVSGRIGYVHKSGVALTFSKSDRFFKVMQDNVSIYDNQKGQLVKVGELRKGQVYPRVRDYGNWHEIRFGKGYGYVWKGATEPTGASGLKNLNKGYGNMNQSFKTATNVEVYDNSLGKLVPFATILKGQEYPYISDYGNWYRVDVSGRIGYVHKNGTHLTFTESDKYFEVTENDVPIYDNSTGELVQVGWLKKGEVFRRTRDYGNWHEIKFGNSYGYVWKGSTEPSNGDKIKNLSQGDANGNEFFEAAVDLSVYDNSTGSLIPFAVIREG